MPADYVEYSAPDPLPVIVCSHDCTYLAQPEGTHGYAHPFRVVAPVVPFEQLRLAPDGTELLNEDALRSIRTNGYSSGLLYVPRVAEFELADPPEEWADHCAVALYRSYLVSQSVLDASGEPVQRMSVDGLRWLHRGLIHTFTGNTFDPWRLKEPDVSDGWNMDHIG